MKNPSWPGLLHWSIEHQDGTAPPSAEPSEQDRQWFQEAMEANDTGKRLAAISTLLGADEVAVQDKADLLEELTEIVENIDHARDLHSVGGLPALIGLLSSPESTLRWHTAGVVAAACQSNPPVQKWFLDGGVLPPLMVLLHDEDSKCRTKALLGVSCLLRHSRPCVEAFADAQGPTHLADLTTQLASSRCRAAVGTSGGSQGPSEGAEGPSQGAEAGLGGLGAASESRRGADGEGGMEELRQLRKCLQLMAYLVREEGSRLSDHLSSSPSVLPAVVPCTQDADADVRQAALGLLGASATLPALAAQLQETSLPEHLQQREADLWKLDVEDLDALREELGLVQGLSAALQAAQSAAHSSEKAGSLQLVIVPEK